MHKTQVLILAAVVAAAASVVVGAIMGRSVTRPADAAPLRVLFLGNSLTHGNDLPGMFTAVAESRGRSVKCHMHAPGGARLKSHAESAAVTKLLASPWDYVVLQEQSQFPAFGRKQLQRDVFPFAEKLVAQARAANPRVGIVFYLTMARRNGDPANRRVSKDLLTYEGTQRRVTACYRSMGEANKALVAPVGEVARLVREQRPQLQLYCDDVHPNRLGSCLAACVLYSSMFGRSCRALKVLRDVNEKDARFVQRIVDKVVLGRTAWDWRRTVRPSPPR